MKSTYFINTVRGFLRFRGVLAFLAFMFLLWVVGWLILPCTTIFIVTIAAIGIACLVAANNTRGMMP